MSTLSVRELFAREDKGGRRPRTLGWPTRSVSTGADLHPTRALSKFVAALGLRTSPVVVDLGQAVGANVSFLGETLGCKLHVEDLWSAPGIWGPVASQTEHPKSSQGGDDGDSTPERVLRRETGSVDGLLCWDVFDYLELDAATALGSEISRVLSPGGVVFVCHAAEQCQIAGPIQHEIVDDMTLRYRSSDRVLPASRVWQSRAVTKIFKDLLISDSFLLTNRMREVVFRKPVASTGAV